MSSQNPIIGSSQALKNCLEYCDAIANSDASVLIQGASGVGKELLANYIHEASKRAGKKLIIVNCASIPRDLFESEFFGHVKGAFTGAIKNRRGRFELADKSTLFLDEVGEIPPELQGKLLRAVQQGTFERIGEEETRHVDVRVICATNRNLALDVEQNLFRRDLFFRLSTFIVDVPPLSQRMEDIEELATVFLNELSKKYQTAPVHLSKQDLSQLQSYDWPGNIRELKNIIERAFILGRKHNKAAIKFAMINMPTNPKVDKPNSVNENKKPYLTAKEFSELERNNLIAALEAANWKISGERGAAELLELKPTTLHSKIKKMNIKSPNETSIYSKMGGEKRIAAFARDLLGRAQADLQLGRFWINRSHQGMRREEKFLTQFLCEAFGGPQIYKGKDMITAHHGLNITNNDWNILVKQLQASLKAMAIFEPVKSEIIKLTETLREQIVQK